MRSKSGIRNGKSSTRLIVIGDRLRQFGTTIPLLSQAKSFLMTSSLQHTDVRIALQKRKEHAFLRSTGMLAMSGLLENTSGSPSVYVLLYQLGSRIRSGWNRSNVEGTIDETKENATTNNNTESDNGTGSTTPLLLGEADQFISGPHVLNGVRGCGRKQEEKLQTEFIRLTTALMRWSTTTESLSNISNTPVQRKTFSLSSRLCSLDVGSVCLLPSDARILLNDNVVELLKREYVKSRATLSVALSCESPNYRAIHVKCKMEDKMWELFMLIVRSAIRWGAVSKKAGARTMFCGSPTTRTSDVLRFRSDATAALVEVVDILSMEASPSAELQISIHADVGRMRSMLWRRVKSRERCVRQCLAALHDIVRNSGANDPSLSDRHSEKTSNVCVRIIDGSRGPWSLRITRLATRLLGALLPYLPMGGRRTGQNSKSNNSKSNTSTGSNVDVSFKN